MVRLTRSSIFQQRFFCRSITLVQIKDRNEVSLSGVRCEWLKERYRNLYSNRSVWSDRRKFNETNQSEQSMRTLYSLRRWWAAMARSSSRGIEARWVPRLIYRGYREHERHSCSRFWSSLYVASFLSERKLQLIDLISFLSLKFTSITIQFNDEFLCETRAPTMSE